MKKRFMKLAINEAWKYQGLTYPNPAVGAVIVKQNKILAISAHKQAGLPHAEVLATKEAYYKLTNDKRILKLKLSEDIHNFLYHHHDNIFQDCIIYTTLEPCNHTGKTPPCSLLLKILNFKQTIIGSFDNSKDARGGAKKLKNVNFLLKNKSNKLLYPFIKWSNSRFVFFKVARSINNVIDGGCISCDDALDMVHKLRDKCDLLIIGGNTVRTDRPTLDSKRVGTKAPDVLIYSKENRFDKTINLFNVPNRKVIISNNFDIIDKYNFIMIEGVDAMFDLTLDIVDYYLVFTSPNKKKGAKFTSIKKLKSLYKGKIGKDEYLRMQRL